MITENSLRNKWLLNIRGLFLISSGTLLLTLQNTSPKYMLLSFCALTLFSGILGVGFTTINKIQESSRGWLVVESYADIIFSFISLFVFIGSIDFVHNFLLLFTFFSFFLFFQKIGNIFRILQRGLVLKPIILISRTLLAIGFGISGLLSMSQFNSEESITLLKFIAIGPLVAGFMLVLMGNKLYNVKKDPRYL